MAHQLQIINDILTSLGSDKYLTKLDLKFKIREVDMHQDSQEKTAFTCYQGLFHYNVMPFGFAKIISIFLELMSAVLQGQEDHAQACLDDILIFPDSIEHYLGHIQEVLNWPRKQSPIKAFEMYF